VRDHLTNPQVLAAAIGAHLADADAGVNGLLGIVPQEISPGRTSCRLTVREHHRNSHRVCHGGIVFALADTALAYASCSTNRSGVTLAANISFVRPARLGDVITATAEVVADGQSAGTAVVRLVDQEGQLVAVIQGTALRLDKPVLPELRTPDSALLTNTASRVAPAGGDLALSRTTLRAGCSEESGAARLDAEHTRAALKRHLGTNRHVTGSRAAQGSSRKCCTRRGTGGERPGR